MIQPYCLAVWEKDTKTYFVFGAGLTIKEVTISSNESIIEWMHKSYWNNVADIHMFKCTREVYDFFSTTVIRLKTLEKRGRSESQKNLQKNLSKESLKKSFKADRWGVIGIQEENIES